MSVFAVPANNTIHQTGFYDRHLIVANVTNTPEQVRAAWATVQRNAPDLTTMIFGDAK